MSNEKKQKKENGKPDIKTFRMVFSAIMIALAVILNRLIPATPVYHLSLDFVPIFALAVMFGPLWSCLSYGIADTIGSICFPYGAYNPGITLSLMLLGLIYGLIFNKKQSRSRGLPVRCLIAALAAFLIKLFITSFFLYLMYGADGTYMAYLITRIPNCIAVFAANMLLLPPVYKLITAKFKE